MISIIIPTYNESGNIKQLVEQIFRACKKYPVELVIVDDNSPDGTGKLAEQLAKKYPITVVHRKGKLGLSSAVVAGFKAAKGSILGVMDADLSHPPNTIPSMIKPILDKKAELVIGSRYVKGGGVEVWPLARRLTSLVATMIARPLTHLRDPVSGYFFMRKHVIQGIRFQSEGYKIGLEVIVKGKYKKVVEVPYVFRNRFVGKSKLSLKEDYYYLKNVLRWYAYRLLHFGKRGQLKPGQYAALYERQDPKHYYAALRKGNPIQRFWHKYKFTTAVNAAGLKNSENVLDCGCGSGTLLLFLPEKVKATVMDVSKGNVRFAQKLRKETKGIVSSIERAKLKQNAYDVIFFIEVIEHLRPEDEKKVLRKLYAALKPGGKLVMTTPNYRSLWPLIEKVWSRMNPLDYAELHINRHNPRSIAQHVKAIGFSPVTVSTFFFISPFVAVISQSLAKLVMKVESNLLPRAGSLILIAAEKGKK